MTFDLMKELEATCESKIGIFEYLAPILNYLFIFNVRICQNACNAISRSVDSKTERQICTRVYFTIFSGAWVPAMKAEFNASVKDLNAGPVRLQTS